MQTRLIALVLACFAVVMPVGAQTAEETPVSPLVTAAYRPAAIYAGPGDTYTIVGTLREGVEVNITERNATGNWLRIVQRDTSGKVTIDGWVMTGYLTLNKALRFSQLPVNIELPDANPLNISDTDLLQLYSAPVISPIMPAMRDVYMGGQEMGNRANVLTKVGDSLSADPLYLGLMAQQERELGPYDYLDETVTFFGKPASWDMLTAKVGLNTYAVLDPNWADPEICLPEETPLECEYRYKKPAIAFIMFGPNDVKGMSPDEYKKQLSDIVNITLQSGVIPVMSTFSYDFDHVYGEQALAFNLKIIEIATEYDLPLINLWSAARSLPSYGLESDLIHMVHSGFRYLKFDSGHESWYGVSLRNLLSIRMLDELRRTLQMENGKLAS